MSLELLPTLEKDVVSKKKTSTDSTTEPKKEGASLFDSLLKNATKEQSNDSLSKDSKDSQQTPVNTKKVIPKEAEKLEDKETPVKKMVNSLVDIVVDSSKKELKDKKMISTDAKEIKVETKESESQKIKQLVEEKVEVIKDAAKEISKVTTEEAEKAVKVNTKAEAILDKVEQKVNVIKEATSKIKEEIKVVTQKDQVTDESKASLKDIKAETTQVKENNKKIVEAVETKINTIEKTTNEITKEVEESLEKTLKVETSTDELESKDTKTLVDKELSSKIEQKVEVIKENAVEIQKEIQKVVVTSDELVKKIQEFKNETKTTSTTQTTKVTVTDTKVETDGEKSDKDSLLSNSFLTSQKQEKQQVSLQNLHNAKTNIEENKTVGAVKESAKILELNPEDVEVEKVGKDGESKSELFAKHNKEVQEQFLQNKSLNKMVIEGQKNSEIINEQIQRNVTETKVVQEENKSATQHKETVLNVNVPQNVVETIQSKIIGAQQKVGSFMSEVARNMYLNYKPPFTAFRMSLNPANLGTISIVMRANNQDNNLSVSMNMSNNNTMETFVENRAALQNALQKQLGEASNITLNFGMDGENNSESFNDTMNQSNGQNNSQENMEQVETDLNTSVEQEQAKSLDYM